MSFFFVNCHGEAISSDRIEVMRIQGAELERLHRVAAKADPVSGHKGWHVLQAGRVKASP